MFNKTIFSILCIIGLIFGVVFLSYRFGYSIARQDVRIETSEKFEEMVGKKEEIEKEVAKQTVSEKRKKLERFVVKD